MEQDYLSVDDLSPKELGEMLDLAADVKQRPEAYASRLAGRSIALIFEKPSTRTRVSFEVGVAQLGAHPVVLSSAELQLGRGETIEDTGRVLSRYLDAIVLRTFEQERLEVLAGAADVPVINSLSDFEHPCQALADLLTMRERLGSLEGRTLTYLGDGNNVAHSLLLGGAKAGMRVRVSPSTVKREEYGSLLGRVVWAAEFPSTKRGMVRVLGNEALVDRLMEEGPPIQVNVALDRDPATPTGYRWSSSTGPSVEISSGTLASGSVIVRQERPIHLIIPKVREKLGL